MVMVKSGSGSAVSRGGSSGGSKRVSYSVVRKDGSRDAGDRPITSTPPTGSGGISPSFVQKVAEDRLKADVIIATKAIASQEDISPAVTNRLQQAGVSGIILPEQIERKVGTDREVVLAAQRAAAENRIDPVSAEVARLRGKFPSKRGDYYSFGGQEGRHTTPVEDIVTRESVTRQFQRDKAESEKTLLEFFPTFIQDQELIEQQLREIRSKQVVGRRLQEAAKGREDVLTVKFGDRDRARRQTLEEFKQIVSRQGGATSNIGVTIPGLQSANLRLSARTVGTTPLGKFGTVLETAEFGGGMGGVARHDSATQEGFKNLFSRRSVREGRPDPKSFDIITEQVAVKPDLSKSGKRGVTQTTTETLTETKEIGTEFFPAPASLIVETKTKPLIFPNQLAIEAPLGFEISSVNPITGQFTFTEKKVDVSEFDVVKKSMSIESLGSTLGIPGLEGSRIEITQIPIIGGLVAKGIESFKEIEIDKRRKLAKLDSKPGEKDFFREQIIREAEQEKKDIFFDPKRFIVIEKEAPNKKLSTIERLSGLDIPGVDIKTSVGGDVALTGLFLSAPAILGATAPGLTHLGAASTAGKAVISFGGFDVAQEQVTKITGSPALGLGVGIIVGGVSYKLLGSLENVISRPRVSSSVFAARATTILPGGKKSFTSVREFGIVKTPSGVKLSSNVNVRIDNAFKTSTLTVNKPVATVDTRIINNGRSILGANRRLQQLRDIQTGKVVAATEAGIRFKPEIKGSGKRLIRSVSKLPVANQNVLTQVNIKGKPVLGKSSAAIIQQKLGVGKTPITFTPGRSGPSSSLKGKVLPSLRFESLGFSSTKTGNIISPKVPFRTTTLKSFRVSKLGKDLSIITGRELTTGSLNGLRTGKAASFIEVVGVTRTKAGIGLEQFIDFKPTKISRGKSPPSSLNKAFKISTPGGKSQPVVKVQTKVKPITSTKLSSRSRLENLPKFSLKIAESAALTSIKPATALIGRPQVKQDSITKNQAKSINQQIQVSGSRSVLISKQIRTPVKITRQDTRIITRVVPKTNNIIDSVSRIDRISIQQPKVVERITEIPKTTDIIIQSPPPIITPPPIIGGGGLLFPTGGDSGGFTLKRGLKTRVFKNPLLTPTEALDLFKGKKRKKKRK